MEAGLNYTATKLAFTLQTMSNPLAALWGYMTNSGRYAQYKAAEKAFNDERAQRNTRRQTF